MFEFKWIALFIRFPFHCHSQLFLVRNWFEIISWNQTKVNFDFSFVSEFMRTARNEVGAFYVKRKAKFMRNVAGASKVHRDIISVGSQFRCIRCGKCGRRSLSDDDHRSNSCFLIGIFAENLVNEKLLVNCKLQPSSLPLKPPAPPPHCWRIQNEPRFNRRRSRAPQQRLHKIFKS